MIGKVTRGRRVSGILHYLFGPGRANEHTGPHLAAAWDPVDELQPGVVDGKHDLRALTALLQQPVLADFRASTRTVWHCALRNAPGDRRLTDVEWDVAVREVLHRTGLAPRDDDGGCRWVAVRHADNHVHIVATLARQDGGPVSTHNDFYRVGEACRAMEEHFDLRRTGERDRTAGRRASRGETEKAQRHGRTEAPRVVLRRAVHSAAAITDSPEAFLTELRASGVLVRERRSEHDPAQVTGFAVAWPGDVNADGEPVWFGGSKLAPELSWARLRTRWDAQTPTAGPAREVDPARRRDALAEAVRATRSASRVLRDGGPASAGSDDIAAAGGDLIVVTGRLIDGHADGTVSRSADRYQRAARVPWARPALPSATAAVLRKAAHDLVRLRRARPSERQQLVDLLRATASLVDALAVLRAAQQRPEQTVAALETAVVLRAAASTLQPTAAGSVTGAPGPTPPIPQQRPFRSAT